MGNIFCLESHIHLCSRHTSAHPAYVIKTCLTWHAFFGARYWGFVSPKLHVSTYRNQQHCWWFHYLWLAFQRNSECVFFSGSCSFARWWAYLFVTKALRHLATLKCSHSNWSVDRLIFSCDQAALQMLFSVRPSVCPSVRLSVCLSVTPFSPCSHHGQKWCPCKRSRSEVNGQGHRGQRPT